MLKQAVFGKDNKEIKQIELNATIFGAKVRRQLLFDCVQAYLNNKRQGTVKAKDRGEVHGTTAKMYRQKGTGQARHGSFKAGIFVGGGSAFPPRPRNWHLSLPQKMRSQALLQALALRRQEGNLFLVDKIAIDQIKTKKMVEQLNKWKVTKGLVVIEKADEKIWKSLRNIPHMRMVTTDVVNALDILSFGKIIVTEAALQQLEKRLA